MYTLYIKRKPFDNPPYYEHIRGRFPGPYFLSYFLKKNIMTIKEKNKLIALYMFPSLSEISNSPATNVNEYIDRYDHLNYATVAIFFLGNFETLNYHTSYDKLIPVAAKILKEENKREDLTAIQNSLKCFTLETGIEALYKSVTNYIIRKNRYEKQ